MGKLEVNQKRLKELHDSENIAEDLEEQELNDIAIMCGREYEIDEQSRQEWLDMHKEAIKIAEQVMEQKTTPWVNASNVKYPLITSSVISFAARTYPEIIQGEKVVLAGIIGPDPTGEKEALARRLSDHMSYQLLVESPNWETDTDKLLTILPLVGTIFRKTYYDPFHDAPASDLCLPERITINDHTTSIETARRITHQLDLYDNDLIERMRAGIFLEIPLEELRDMNVSDNGDTDTPKKILEMHRFLDLDDDGYAEPYAVTFHKESRKILRIKACFDLDKVRYNSKGEIVKIPRIQYFTDYHFLRRPNGKFHSMGYGALLYPINETINTTINQILDAGTLQNRQSGFFAKGLRMVKGLMQFKPGEWKPIDSATGSDISKSIYPLPVNPPSPVLLQLLQMMIVSGKELGSVTDILQGQAQTQNSPATTVMALLKQSLKVHTAIIKRLHQSLKKEFEKIVRLNRIYLDDLVYFKTYDGDGFVKREDYANENLMVYPVADPNISSDAQRLGRAQALINMLNDPDLERKEILTRYFDAIQVPRVETLFKKVDPNAPPPPEIQKLLAEIDLMRAETSDIVMKRELEAMSLELRDKLQQAQAAEAAARVAQMRLKAIADFAKIEQDGQHFALEQALNEVTQEESQENAPQEQQIVYVPSDILQKIQNQAQGQQQQPPQGENPKIPPELQQQLMQEGDAEGMPQ